MKELELKPCPFCGGEAALTVLESGVSVICWNCKASTATRIDSIWLSKPTNAVKSVIEKWNRRTNNEK